MADEQPVQQIQEVKPSDKELNFRQLEAKFERQLAAERAERERLQKELDDRSRVQQNPTSDDDDDDDSEPYVDKKKLNKKLGAFEKKLDDRIEKKAEEKATILFQKEKQKRWMDDHKDFYEVMQHAEKIVQTDPELAETILELPEGFERQKLVYKNIKALGLNKPEVKQPSIQEKIDANRRSPYYQPTGVSNAPYAMAGDFSDAGKKAAHAKMQELKNRLRL